MSRGPWGRARGLVAVNGLRSPAGAPLVPPGDPLDDAPGMVPFVTGAELERRMAAAAGGPCSDLGAVAAVSARTWTPESWEAEIAGCRADASRWGHDTGEGLCWRLAWHLAAAAAEVRPRPARAFSISSAVWAITFGLPSVY